MKQPLAWILFICAILIIAGLIYSAETNKVIIIIAIIFGLLATYADDRKLNL